MFAARVNELAVECSSGLKATAWLPFFCHVPRVFRGHFSLFLVARFRSFALLTDCSHIDRGCLAVHHDLGGVSEQYWGEPEAARLCFWELVQLIGFHPLFISITWRNLDCLCPTDSGNVGPHSSAYGSARWPRRLLQKSNMEAI